MTNTILIVMDELMAYNNMPKHIRDQLPGYNAFKKIGIEFTNIHCNRTVCSPSRATIMSGVINHGVQDNIDQSYQYNFIAKLNPDHDTLGKICKENGYDITAYYGKQHFDSAMASTVFTAPMINTNSRHMMEQYGYDIYSTFGDNFYTPQQGLLSDLYTWELKISNADTEYDYMDHEGNKFIGMLPFLKARLEDKKKFYCEYHITNPHDTQHMIQNIEQLPTGTQLQYGFPFMEEQVDASTMAGTNAITSYDKISNKNFNKNYFEQDFELYKNYIGSLPFVESYVNDYSTSSTSNNIFPFYVCNALTFQQVFTFPNSQSDYKSWKNLISNYWGLVVEADNYVYSVYKFLETNKLLSTTNVIITADHGDQMSAHGLKQKNFPFKETLNVPLIIASDSISQQSKGKTSNTLGSSIDILPTIYTLLKISKSYTFLGKSLLKFVNNSFVASSQNSDALHICNGWMFMSSYFNWQGWYSAQSQDVLSRVYYNPTNIFQYLGPFVVNQTIIDKVQYKFVRYFNLLELLRYNFAFVKKTMYNMNDIILELKKIDKFEIQKYTTNINNIHDKLHKLNIKNFSFTTIINLFSNADCIELYLLMMAFGKIISNNNYNIWVIPGAYDTYTKSIATGNYAFCCYNMTTDPNEVINLADPLYPERNNVELFEKLNKNLNDSLAKYNCDKLLYNFSDDILLNSISIFNGGSSDFVNFNRPKFLLLLTSNFRNNFDTKYSTELIINSLLAA